MNISKSKFNSILETEILDNYQQIVIVTDENVSKLYNSEITCFIESLCEHNKEAYLCEIVPGEESKCIKMKKYIEHFLFKNNIKRIGLSSILFSHIYKIPITISSSMMSSIHFN